MLTVSQAFWAVQGLVENHAVDIWQLCLWIVLVWGVWFVVHGERLWFEDDPAGGLFGRGPLHYVLPRLGLCTVCMWMSFAMVQEDAWTVLIPVTTAAVCGKMLWTHNRKTLVALGGATAFLANVTKIMDSGAFAHISRLLSGG